MITSSTRLIFKLPESVKTAILASMSPVFHFWARPT